MSSTTPDPGLFTRLTPVLDVRDLATERAFYERPGLPVSYIAGIGLGSRSRSGT